MHKIAPAHRTKNVKYAIRDIAVLAKQVEKEKPVIYLNVGDPNKYDFDTPEILKEAVTAAIHNRHNDYSDSQGVSEALEAISNHNNKLGISTDTRHIMISFGVSEAVGIFIASLVNRGENIILPRPSYPIYPAYSNLFEIDYRFYTLDEENEWGLNINDVESQINEKTKALVVINPNNPTGGLYDRKSLEELVNLAGQHNLIIFSDEIYDEMVLEGEMHHIAQFSGEVPVVTCNGLAKNFLSPGWRTGWLSVTDRNQRMEDVTAAIMQLGRARLCGVTPQQFAIKPALESNRPHLKATLRKLRGRRDITYKRINEIDGLSLVKPKAAFYAFPRIDFEIDDKEFVMNLLKEEGVAVVHGSGFDMPGHFRIVYLPEENKLHEAFDKIERFVKNVKI